MSDQPQPLRAIAAGVLLAVENGQSLSQCLPPALARLPISERPALQALCYGSCRWFHRLDDELQGRLKKTATGFRPRCSSPDAGSPVPVAFQPAGQLRRAE